MLKAEVFNIQISASEKISTVHSTLVCVCGEGERLVILFLATESVVVQEFSDGVALAMAPLNCFS